MATDKQDNIEKMKLLVDHLIAWNKEFDRVANEFDVKLMAFITIGLGLSGWGIMVFSSIALLFIIPFIIAILLFIIGLWPKDDSLYPSYKWVIYGSYKDININDYLNGLLHTEGLEIDENGRPINQKIFKEIIEPKMKRFKNKSRLWRAGVISILVGIILIFIHKLLIM